MFLQVFMATVIHLKDDKCRAESHIFAKLIRTRFGKPLDLQVRAVDYICFSLLGWACEFLFAPFNAPLMCRVVKSNSLHRWTKDVHKFMSVSRSAWRMGLIVFILVVTIWCNCQKDELELRN